MAYTGSSVAGGEGNTTFNATSKLDFLINEKVLLILLGRIRIKNEAK